MLPFWAVVCEKPKHEKIQEVIGKKIGSSESWKNKTYGAKAQDIFKILSNKKFVLLLDDL